jgi:hypothetical protein
VLKLLISKVVKSGDSFTGAYNLIKISPPRLWINAKWEKIR